MKPIYATQESNGIIIGIGKIIPIDFPGTYTETLIERLLPTDEELDSWTEKQGKEWTEKNNKFMTELCNLMNKHNLQTP